LTLIEIPLQKTLVLLCNKDDQKPFASQHFSIKKEATLKKDCSKWILLQRFKFDFF